MKHDSFLFSLFSTAFLVGLAGLIPPPHPDEAVFLTIANQLQKGALPYLHFFDNKPPGIYFVFWIAVSIFGNNLLVLRLTALLATYLTALLIFLLAKRLSNRYTAVLSSIAYLIFSPIYQGNFLLTEVLMNIFILASALAAILFSYRKLKRYIFVTGLLTGIATIFKQPAFINSVIHLIFLLFIIKNRDNLKSTFLYLSGVFLPWGIILVYLLSYGIIGQAIWQMFLYNFLVYKPWPIQQTLFSLPKILYPAIIIWLAVVVIIFNKEKKSWKDYFLIASIISITPILLTRPYHHYWLQILPFSLILVFRWFKYHQFWLRLLKINTFIAGIAFIGYNLTMALLR